MYRKTKFFIPAVYDIPGQNHIITRMTHTAALRERESVPTGKRLRWVLSSIVEKEVEKNVQILYLFICF